MPTNWLGWIVGGFFFGFAFQAGAAVFHSVVDLVKAGKDKGKP